MTLNDAINIDDAKIDYLGGIEVVAAYVPYSRRLLKDNIVQTYDHKWIIRPNWGAWMEAAGFRLKNPDLIECEKTGGGLAKLCETKGIDKITCDEAIEILQRAAVRIAKMSEAEYNAILKKGQFNSDFQEYTVTFAVSGVIQFIVRAKSEEDAQGLARIEFRNANTGDIELDGTDELICIADENGHRTDYA